MSHCKIPFATYFLAGVLAAGALLRGAEETPAAAPNVRLLRQIILADNIETAPALKSVPDGGFLIVPTSLAAIDKEDLLRRLKAGENRPIDDRLLAGIATVVETFMKSTGFALATVVIPPQNIADGTLRVVVLPGKVRHIKFEGNHWFSESLLREKMRLERGNLVRVSELERALAATNNNPYRRVKVHVEPVPDTGEADLFVGVQDRLPLRLTVGYENTGNEILGYDRYSVGLTYGNLWGLEHQITYQQMFSQSTTLFRAHAIDYRAPLSWGHVFSFSGSYAKVNPTFYSGLFTQLGKSTNADAKYTIPFHLKQWDGEFTSTLGFKQSNNNLEFGGVPAFGNTSDLFTGSISAAIMRPDKRGRWAVSATLTGSPGNLNNRNNEATFTESRVGANPHYGYAQFWAQRVTWVTPQLTSLARISTQLASTNLVPSEQFSVGGAYTVRGYEERILTGDGGYIATHELQHALPALSLGQRLPKLESSAAFFWDYGRTIIKHPLIGEAKSVYLSSVGIGLRLSLANNFSASADYARQLEEVETPGAAHSRLHVKMTLAY